MAIMNLFLLTVSPIFLFVFLTFIDGYTNIPTDFTCYKIATAITAAISIISAFIISRKLDEVFEACYIKDENKLPSQLGFWDAFWYKFNPSKKNQSLLSEIREEYCTTDVKQLIEYDWDTIVAGTDNFSDSNVVGRGKSGTTTIFKAVLPPCEELVAVKRFSQYSEKGLDEFTNEILLVPKLDHPNIIKLLGYCIHKNEKLLVYELMPITSGLDSLLYGRYKDRLKLFYLRQWSVRFKIIMGIAEGVAYLHQDLGPRVVHGDLNLSNILLDLNMNPKISGFSSSARSRTLDMSQDYYEQMKSDIYRFGVIVLVMVTGRRITMDSDISIKSLVHYAWKVWEEWGSLALVDKTIFGKFEAKEAGTCVVVGLLCTLEDPNYRPHMNSVLKTLQGENDPTSSSSDAGDDDDLGSKAARNT